MLVTALVRRSVAGYSLAYPGALGLAMLGGGTTGSGSLDSRTLKKFTDNSTVSCISLAMKRQLHTAVGNTSKAVSMAGTDNTNYDTSNTESYLYSTNTLGVSSSAFANDSQVGYGNGTDGYLGASSSAVRKYNYATDAITVATTFTADHRGGYGFGNTTAGYAASGTTSSSASIVEKYTYTTQAVVSTTSLSIARRGAGASCSNASIALIIAGKDQNNYNCGAINTYSLVDSTQTANASMLSDSFYGNAAACNSSVAHSFCGHNSSVAVSYDFKYDFTTKAVTQLTGLSTALYNAAATSDSHGGL